MYAGKILERLGEGGYTYSTGQDSCCLGGLQHKHTHTHTRALGRCQIALDEPHRQEMSHRFGDDEDGGDDKRMAGR